LIWDLGPTSAAHKPVLASSSTAEKPVDGCQCGPLKLMRGATFGSFGIPSFKLIQLPLSLLVVQFFIFFIHILISTPPMEYIVLLKKGGRDGCGLSFADTRQGVQTWL
jgi:hypothetical protein